MAVEILLRTQESETPFVQLLLAVFNSILEVFILCAAGYTLARHGILDKKTQKQINRLNVSLFTPALLFSKVAFFLTPAKLKELWVIPIWFVIVTTASMSVGRVLGFVFGLKQSQRSFVMAAAMFMNSNALPIALMQSLVISVPDLAWGDDDNRNAMLGRALTYLTMYSTLGMVVRYSYGVSLLSRADTILVPTAAHNGDADENTPLLLGDSPNLRSQPSTSTITVSGSYQSSKRNSHSGSPRLVHSPKDVTHADLPELIMSSRGDPPPPLAGRPHFPRRRTTFYNSFPNSPNNSVTNLARYDTSLNTTDTEDSDEENTRDVEAPDSGLPAPSTHHVRQSSHSHTHHPVTHFLHHVGRRVARFWVALNDFMTMPLWSATLSLFVACISPLKHALEFHMQPLNNAINTAGKCAVPLTLVVLGAYFYVPPPEGSDTTNTGERRLSRSERKSRSRTLVERVKDTFGIPRYQRSSTPPAKKEEPLKPGETKTVALAVAARMVITPVLLVPLMVFATRFDWHAIFEDPVFVTVNTILLCSPPALTLAQITAAVSGDAFERLISRTIFWSYCIITPPVTIGSVLLGLWLAKL
ncbi:unnamed protein product [Cyclocybe aegerita]|uniref:Auxin efflux carrier n=1 Tax=Cyclocybe aegerita TaxID=1973307 RepID=A0A8S0XSR4_CYCAE|nr:unnamed protein product [Cyclocybe aegerita]